MNIAPQTLASTLIGYGWSSAPTGVAVVGNVSVFVGLVVAPFVVFQNGYASANITEEAGQPLVSSGCTAWCDIRCTSVR